MARLTVVDALKYVRFEALGLPEDRMTQELIAHEMKNDYPFCNFWITEFNNGKGKVYCVLQQIPK